MLQVVAKRPKVGDVLTALHRFMTHSSRRRRSNIPSEPVDRMFSSALIDTKPSARVPDFAEHAGPYAVPLNLDLKAARSVEEISRDHSHSNARRLADSLGEAIRNLVDVSVIDARDVPGGTNVAQKTRTGPP